VKRFYLIDGHAQVFRAYYAPFRELTAPDGRNVKAAYVFTQLMTTLLSRKPDYLAVAFDVSDATTFRKDNYAAYKDNRDESPEDLGPQFGMVRDVLDAMRIPIFEQEGFEADDVITTIAKTLPDDVELRIVSKDKDLHQILTDRVGLYDPKEDRTLFGPDLLEAKGYTPEQAVEIQTLVGDPTDNIPGVDGIGVKTAAKLIQAYGSAQAVLDHASEMTPKRREKLEAARDVIPITRELVTLRDDVPMVFDLASCATPTVTRADVEDVFHELGFRRLFDRLPGSGDGGSEGESSEGADYAHPDGEPAVERHYRTVTTQAELAELTEALERVSAFAVDTETTSLRARDAELLGVAVAFEEGEGWYVPLEAANADTLGPEAVLSALRPHLENDGVLKVGQNLKYDRQVLWNVGIDLKGPSFDTMIAAAVLHPERRGVGLDALARDFLRMELTPTSALIGKGKQQKSMRDVPLEALAHYAAEDADATWRLYHRLNAEVEDAGGARKDLLWNVEFPLERVLARMEYRGVKLDEDLLRTIASELDGRINELRLEIQQAAGRPFNPDSPTQLGEVLFDDLGMRVVRRTKTGRSTDAAVLETLAGETEHPLPKLVLEYRELTKLHGTYVAPLPTYLSPADGRLHASFNQVGAATGRLSSSDPNIQNIPVRTDAGRRIRQAFVAGGAQRLLLTADYSQVELRMLAHLSGDEAMRTAFQEGFDIHAFVASQVYNVAIDDVTAEQRRVAKTVNFGIVYGQTAFGLAKTLSIPQGDAAAFIEAYKTRYPGIDRYLAACIEQAETHGFVETLLGRRRPVEEIRSRNRQQRALGERLAINTVVQGSAADLIKLAMIQLDRRLDAHPEWDARMIIQVHDELVFDVADTHADAVKTAVVDEMTHAMTLDVPIAVDAAVGPNWAQSKG
jgi:DNA polymerase-1